MGRMILDEDLRRWEAFATTGEYGFPDRSRIVFRCVSDAHQRARAVVLPGDKSDAEQEVEARSELELRELLAEAPEIG